MPIPRAQLLKAVATQNRVAPPVPLIAPITGWNTRDALDGMMASDAVLLDNWFPDTAGVTVRNGYVSYATGVGSGPVKTLAEFNAGSVAKVARGCIWRDL